MEYLEAFQGNTGKHLRNITSHVDFPRNVSGENMTRLREVQKTTKIEGYK